MLQTWEFSVECFLASDNALREKARSEMIGPFAFLGFCSDGLSLVACRLCRASARIFLGIFMRSVWVKAKRSLERNAYQPPEEAKRNAGDQPEVPALALAK